MIESLRAFAIFILWNIIVASAMMIAPLPVALIVIAGVTGLLLWGYLLRGPRGVQPERRWATLRLRPLRGSTLRWSLVAVPVALLFAHFAQHVYSQLVSVPPETLEQFRPLMETRDRRLLLMLLAVGIAPLVEEFVFRGVVQRSLERRLGTWWGISAASFTFAVVHLLPWIMPLHFMLGLLFGVAVWASRSIWTGVLLHAANNAVAVFALAFSGPESAATETIWGTGAGEDFWLSLAALGVATVAVVWVARRLYRAAHGERLRAA